MSLIKNLFYPSEIISPDQCSMYHPLFALWKFIDHWYEFIYWTHKDHYPLTIPFVAWFLLIFTAGLIRECWRYIHKCVEIAEPRSFWQLGNDKNPLLVNNVDLVLDGEINVFHWFACFYNCCAWFIKHAIQRDKESSYEVLVTEIIFMDVMEEKYHFVVVLL